MENQPVNLEPKDKLPTILTEQQIIQQVKDSTHELHGVLTDSKPVLVKPDYKAMAKKFFLENFQGILTLAISGNSIRLIVIGIILLLLFLFGVGIF